MGYTFRFKFGIHEKVFDKLSNKEVTICGIAYINGRTVENDVNYFHEVAYYTDSSMFHGLRAEENLEKI